MDSRLRGNDGINAVAVIPAKAGIHGFSDKLSLQARSPNTDAQARHGPSMTVLDSSLSVHSDAFRANRARMQRMVEETSGIAAKIMQGGPEHARTRHLNRGKLLPRERVARLLDPGSPFLEIGLFAAHGMYEGEVPVTSPADGTSPSYMP